MSELKTHPTDQKVAQFIEAVESDQKRHDCWAVVEMMREITGAEPVMWGPSIIGFGTYTYVNTTKKPADWPIVAAQGKSHDLCDARILAVRIPHDAARQALDRQVMPLHKETVRYR